MVYYKLQGVPFFREISLLILGDFDAFCGTFSVSYTDYPDLIG